MNNLLIFFAIPFAVIVISIALQKLLKCPYLVAAIILSIFLVIGFALSSTMFLVAGIVYTIISFVTAYLTMIICRIFRNNNNCSIISTLNNGNQNTQQLLNDNDALIAQVLNGNNPTNGNFTNRENARSCYNRNRL